MARHLIHFTQNSFTRPNVPVFTKEGDFDYSYSLLPNPTGAGLRRAPAWSSQVNFSTGFTACRAMFYYPTTTPNNGRIIFVGAKNNHITTTYMTFPGGSFGAASEIDTGAPTLGGVSSHNIAWQDEDLYYIRSDKKMYKSAGYINAGTVVYSNQDARILTVAGDRIILADTSGELYMLTRTGAMPHLWYTATGTDVWLLQPLNGLLTILARESTGDLSIYKLRADPAYTYSMNEAIMADPASLDKVNPDLIHVATIAGSGNYPPYGSLFAAYQDEIFFTAGRRKHYTYIYRTDGTRVALADQVPYSTTSTETDGLATWQDQLLFYTYDTSVKYTRVWMGDGFTWLTPPSQAPFNFPTGFTPFAAAVGPTFAVTDNDGTNEGVYYLTQNFSPSATLVTSHLTLGHPGRKKRLARIVITFNETSATAKLRVQYTPDQQTSLIELQAAKTISSVHVIEPSTPITFYTIQLMLTFSDTATGANVQDIAPQTISVIASVGD